MTWDPEIHDRLPEPLPVPDEPSDVGIDHARDLGDEPPPAYRTAAPDPLAPIDPNAPVSGHHPPPESTHAVEPLEHDWETARTRIAPLLRPAGTAGLPIDEVDAGTLASQGATAHPQPLVAPGPAGLVIVFALPSAGFDVIVNADHVATWGVDGPTVRDVAMANLARWSAAEGWTEEQDGQRLLLSSATGDGWDASRILLPEVRRHLAATVGGNGDRVLVGLPERHLLVVGRLSASDPEFGPMFAEFVVETAGGADEPIDRRVFELAGDELVDFGG